MKILGEIVNDGVVTVLGGVTVALGGITASSEIRNVLFGHPPEVGPLLFSVVAVGVGLYGFVGGGIRLLYDLNDLRHRA
ncbi:MAG: hypothetical protein AAB506_02540 [Patescibacteria group bacterium]